MSGAEAVLVNGSWRSVPPGFVPSRPHQLGWVLLAVVGFGWASASAAAVVLGEAQGRMRRLHTLLLWPIRHPVWWLALSGATAVMAAAAIGLVTATAVLLLRGSRSTLSLVCGTIALILLLATVRASLVPLFRLIYRGIMRQIAPSLVAEHGEPATTIVRRGAIAPVWWSCVVGMSVGAVATWASMRFGWPGWVNGGVAAIIVLGCEGAVLAASLDTVLPDVLPAQVDVSGPVVARRWSGVVLVAVLPVLLIIGTPAMLPTGVIAFRQTTIPGGVAATDLSVGGDRALLISEYSHDRDRITCLGMECVQRHTLGLHSDRVLSQDGALEWRAFWSQTEEEVVEGDPWRSSDDWESDPDALVTLRLDASATVESAEASVPNSREVVTTTAGELFPELPIDVIGAQGTVAMAERDGVVAILATGNRGDHVPVYLIRCVTGEECTVGQTTLAHQGSTVFSGGAVAIDSAGVVHAVMDGITAPSGHGESGVAVLSLDAGGALHSEYVAPPSGEVAPADGRGVSLAISPDDMVWVLHVAGADRGQLFRCDDALCRSRTESEHAGIEQGTDALVVDDSNRPLIVTADSRRHGLVVRSCVDTECSDLRSRWLSATAERYETDPTSLDDHVGLALDDGRPVIAFTPALGLRTEEARLIRCERPRCGID
ncbi:hypothetical protein [Cellulomonas sp. NPDC089187]|uniref:hypothetical protein n=1 Tax=Cellulomonas sp. NPDC089187 TaxID=3154970 RepID=UPI003425550E